TGRVPCAPTIVAVAPGDGVVRPHGARAGVVCRLVDRREYVHGAARVRPEVVPLVRARPSGRQVDGRGMVRVLDVDAGRLDRGMAREVRPEQPAVPRPVVLGVGRGMNSHEPATRPDVALEGSLLCGVE